MKDLLTLSLVDKKFNSIFSEENLKKIAIKKIVRRLQEICGQGYEDFVGVLIRARAAISGSFLHQCINGEEFENSDIDIYVHRKKGKELGRFLEHYSENSNYG